MRLRSLTLLTLAAAGCSDWSLRNRDTTETDPIDETDDSDRPTRCEVVETAEAPHPDPVDCLPGSITLGSLNKTWTSNAEADTFYPLVLPSPQGGNAILMKEVTSSRERRLVWLDPRTGLRLPDSGSPVVGYPGFAGADLNGALGSEVLAVTSKGTHAVVAADGLSTSDLAISTGCREADPAIADLDGDGTAELFWGPLVFTADRVEPIHYDGPSCSAVAGREPGWQSRTALVADLDLDGSNEVVYGRSVYDSAMELKCVLPEGYDAVVVADIIPSRSGAEVAARRLVPSLPSDVAVFSSDCQQLRTVQLRSLVPGATAGDLLDVAGPFVSEGRANLVVAVRGTADDATQWRAYALDEWLSVEGEVDILPPRWNQHAAADLDGDGRVELLTDRGQIIDLRTGTIRIELPCSIPIVVDADADNHGEVYCIDNSDDTLRLARYDGDPELAPVQTYWHQYGFNISALAADGSVPSSPSRPWSDFNSYRASMDDGHLRFRGSDLVAEIVDVCGDECSDGKVVLSVRLGNRGSTDIGVPITAIVEGRVGQERVTLGSETWDVLPAGMWAASKVVVVNRDDVDQLWDLAVRPSMGPNTLSQCDSENDQALWDQRVCP